MTTDKLIKIGSIDAPLALWQTGRVRAAIDALGYRTAVIPITLAGDAVSSLDAAVLGREIDIAIYSMIDVPLSLTNGIVQAAVLERHAPYEVLVYKDAAHVMTKYEGKIAANTSLRKAQWLNHYSGHSVDRIDGSINTRLQILAGSEWNGAVFSGALLDGLEHLTDNYLSLDWMLPAPAQDAVLVCAREGDKESLEICANINHEHSEICTRIERDFMQGLGGEALLPIGAFAEVSKNWRGIFEIELHGALLSLDGRTKLDVRKTSKLSQAKTLGVACAQEIMSGGGKFLMDENAKQIRFENARRKSTPPSKSVKTRAATGAQKEIKQPVKKPVRRATDLISLVSTQKLAEEHLAMLRKRYKVENLDFIQTVYSPIPPEAVRTDSMIIASPACVDSLLASFPRLNLRFKNIYCIGEKTRKLVEARLGRVLFTAASPRELAVYLCQNMSGRAITYFCSTLRRDDLPDILAKHHIKVTEIPAYEMRNAGQRIDRDIDGVLFFNPASVRSFVQTNSTEIPAFCMGEITATEASKHFKTVQSTKLASTEHMLQLVNKHFA